MIVGVRDRRDIKTQGEGRWHDRDGVSHVWRDPTYFHYPTTKSKK